MNKKECYVIITKDNKFLNFEQENSTDVFVCETENILHSYFFCDIKEVQDIMSAITNKEEGYWEYSKTFNTDELNIIKINLEYEVYKMQGD